MSVKKIYPLFIILILAASVTLRAQQNLFNVPSLEITEHKKQFLQYQANVTQQMQNNITYDVGLGKDWEIGFNILALNVNTHPSTKVLSTNPSSASSEPLYPLFMLNAQKAITLSKLLKISAGLQLGANPLSAEPLKKQASLFTYINSKLKLNNNRLQLVNGIYYGNKNFLGKGTPINIMNGIEYTAFKKFHLMGDVFWGNNYISEFVIGGVYYITPHFTLSSGYQMPTPNSKSSKGFVFELTLF